MGTTNLNGNFNGAGRIENPPFQSDLLLRYTGRSSLDLIESISGRNGKIIPACGKTNATNYATLSIVDFEVADTSGYIEVKFYFDGTNAQHILWGSCNKDNNSGYFYVRVLNKLVRLDFRNGITPDGTVVYWADALVTAGWYTVRFTSTGTAYTITVNGEDKPVTKAGPGQDGDWLNVVASPNARDDVTIGAALLSTPVLSATDVKIAYVDYSNKHKWICTGEGDHVYDIIGTNHLTWVGSAHIEYDIEGSTELLDNGYSEWRKAGKPYEYVPYKNGVPYDTGTFLLGYLKQYDSPGSSNNYNFPPSVVDFDPNNTAHADLNSFDKSNATYHIATGSMNYYDAAEVYRWRQDELSSPRIYSTTYKNNNYRGMLMLKGLVTGTNVVRTSEILVYTTDREGSEQYSIAIYCGLSGIVIKSGGSPVYDGDGYLTWLFDEPVSASLVVSTIGNSVMDVVAAYFAANTEFTVIDIANNGDTIAQQHTAWDLLTVPQQQSIDYVLIQLGLNDLAGTTAQFTTDFQSFIDKIELDTKVGCKIIVGNMTPCYGFFQSETTLTVWLADNEAINGEGVYALTDIDSALPENNTDLNDGANSMLAEYDSGDGLHPNTTGSIVLFNNFLEYIL